MRPIRTSLPLNALGYSPPILHDYHQSPPNVTLAVMFSADSAGSPAAEVQFCIDDLSIGSARRVARISQTTTVITVVGDSGLPGPPLMPTVGNYTGDGGTHGLSVGDLVQLLQTGNAKMDGWYNVASVVSETSYTLTSTTSQTAVASGSALVISGRMFTHGTLTALSARAVGNYGYPVSASRLHVATAGSAGVVTLAVLQGLL